MSSIKNDLTIWFHRITSLLTDPHSIGVKILKKFELSVLISVIAAQTSPASEMLVPDTIFYVDLKT